MAKTNKVLQSFNAGELSPLMDSRIDQNKYLAGCRTLENFIPLIFGGVERRPGLEYIATQKSSSAKGRVVAFEHSVNDTYTLLFENQVIRVFRNGGQVLERVGTENYSAFDNVVAQWRLNDNIASQTVIDHDDETHNGSTVTNNTSVLHAAGKTGTGAFNFGGADAVEINDHNDFSFDDSGSNPFSALAWIYVTDSGVAETILSKWKGGTAREWKLQLSPSRKLQLMLSDDSTGLDTDRVAHWKLNENTTNTAVDDDVGVVPHDGVASTNTENLHSPGRVGSGCFDFEGTHYVEVSDNAALSFIEGVNGDFSISAWIYATNSGVAERIVTKYNGTTSVSEYAFSLTGSQKLYMILYDDVDNKGITCETDVALSAGWHFVVMTYEGEHASWTGATAADYITLYVDGEVVASTATNHADYTKMVDTATKLRIGIDADGVFPFQDRIDNVTIFDKTLSAANVTHLYNDGFGTEDMDATSPYKETDDALSVGWHHIAATYDSTGGATAANGIILYVDGAAVDSTATNYATYVAMENTATKVRIGAQIDSGDNLIYVFKDKIDNVVLFKDVLTPTEIAGLYSTTAYEIDAPYLTADLFELKFEHSADVMYITHPDYEDRKLSRTGHTSWALEVLALEDGPFRDQNTDTADTIVASATTGTVTLTATGCWPFVMGTTAGHSPSGSAATSKSQTGALFKLVHAITTDSIDATLADAGDKTSEITVYKGITWDFTTQGTWTGTCKVEREYGNSGVWETVFTVVGKDNKNATTSGTEEFEDAQYRIHLTASGDAAEGCEVQFSVRDSAHIGIVKITAVASPTSATATVLRTLAATTATHRWSEGAFSNYRGWPVDVTISPEERLTFTGSPSEPLTAWGSVIGNWESFKEGVLDDDAITHTLIGSGQQNQIQWALTKTALILGTVGGEHILGASSEEEALTPINVKAKLQTTHGSENIAALIVNQAILFVQRGGRKIREFLYNWQSNDYVADDLTVFANHITESGIVDMAFQRTPDPTLWCVRDDGVLAVMTYERKQDVFSWYRIVTSTADSDSDFESVDVIYGGAGKEDEVWVTVKRTLSSGVVRYVERFYQRAMPDDMDDMKYLDSFLTYDSTSATSTITGLDHLEGETVQVLADGEVFDDATVSGNQITLKKATVVTTASTVQVGLGYTSTLKPMKLNIADLGLATTKKISRAIINLYNTIGGEMGTTMSNVKDIPTGTDALFAGEKELSMPGGYSRAGDIIVRQTQPLPMTVLSLTLDIGASAD